MRPPICEVCDDPFDPGSGGGLVSFIETDAGRRFADRAEAPGFVGHPPDDGWFCPDHVAAARGLSTTSTLSDAVGILRGPVEPAPTTAGTHVGPSERARAEVEHRDATAVEHALGSTVAREIVAEAFRSTAATLLERLGLADVEPVVDERRSTSPSPEPRESITATEIDSRTVWTSERHVVELGDRDIVWDAWSGLPRGGDLMQGTLTLVVDDTWLFASYGSDGLVSRLDESGDRTPAVGDLLDALVERLRSHP